MPSQYLLPQANHLGINIFEKPMPYTTKGLYADNVIWINKYIPTSIEKNCVLAEELGHHHTSYGDILDQRLILNRKQEKKARNWAYQRLVPLKKIVQAFKGGVGNRYELAEYLGVTEEFLEDALNWYQEKYGLYATIGHHTIRFNPLVIFEDIRIVYP